MRNHDHYPSCRYNGMPSHKAWARHVRGALFSWMVAIAVLYGSIVVVAICVKAIR